MEYTALISWKATLDADSDEAAIALAESLMRSINGPQPVDAEKEDCCAVYYGEADVDYVENSAEGKIIHGAWRA